MSRLSATLACAILLGCHGGSLKASTANEVFDDRNVARLAVAVCSGDIIAIDRAVSEGANVNASGKGNMTPLAWAMNCRSVTGVKALLEKGADPNKRVVNGVSPVWLASTYKKTDFLAALVSAGGSLNGSDLDRNTSALLGGLTSGFQNGVWDNYYFALNHGADVNIRYGPQPGITVAEKAVALGLFDKALELLHHGYNKDLNKLAEFASSRPADQDSDQARYKAELLQRLNAG